MFQLDSGVFYKECNVCNTTQQSKSFRIRTDGNYPKRRPFCLNCESDKRSNVYVANKVVTRENARKRKELKPVEKILIQAKGTARKKNLEFNIGVEDIVLPKFCKYLGIKLTNLQGQGVVWSNYSIDRIDPAKGYIKGNVEIISRKANSMKNMATEQELIVFAKNILKLYGE